jgi:hypothetical protein
MNELCVAIGSICRSTYQIQRVKYLVSGDVVWRYVEIDVYAPAYLEFA